MRYEKQYREKVHDHEIDSQDFTAAGVVSLQLIPFVNGKAGVDLYCEQPATNYVSRLTNHG